MNETIVKHLNFGQDARDKIFSGINKLTNAVSSTLGASGKCVIMEDNTGKPIITKDGVTVADNIILLDPVENMGARLLKEAAQRTVKDAGDGTTTATILAKAILEEATKHDQLDTLRNIKDGINTGVDNVIKYLQKKRKKISGKKIDQVATISANNDKDLGRIIGEAFKLVDETGVVIMETHDENKTLVEVINGAQYERGLLNPHFITNQDKGTCELEDPYVLLVENKIENIRQIQGVLEFIIKGNKSLLIIAETDPTVTSALAMNKIKGNIKINIIDAPVYGVNKQNTLQDLSLITGATIINEDLGDDMDMLTEEHLGKCKRSITSNSETILQINNASEQVEEVIKDLKEKLQKETNPNVLVALEKRLARLSGKVAVVKVGASSEVELKEKRDRVEDAICATKAAIKEGIVPGGGIALLNAAQTLKPKNIGEEVLYCAIKKPFEVILNNAGITEYETPDIAGKGLDVVTGKTVDMVKAGIIDPLLVTKSALQNAASVATTILSTDCVINNLRANESSR
jgi:chaperonin GroEL